MESILALLLLVLLKLYPGGGPAHTLAQTCPSADVVVQEGRKQVIINIPPEKNDFHYSDLYVKPQSSFEGLSVNVTGTNGKQFVASFSADSVCFPDYGQWYKLWVSAQAHADTNTLTFRFTNGKCKRECEMSNSTESLQRFKVVAHGSSSWLLKQPGCRYVDVAQFPHSTALLTCSNNLLSNSGDAPLSVGTTIIVIVVAVIVLAGLIVLVAVRVQACRKRQHDARDPASPSTEPASDIHTMENEQCEPMDKYADSAAYILPIKDTEETYAIKKGPYELRFGSHEHGYEQ